LNCCTDRPEAQTEGVKAWIDPESYRWVAGKKRAFEDEVEEEPGATKSPCK